MGDFLPPAEIRPFLVFGAAVMFAALLFIFTMMVPEEPQRPWRWGDKPRRPEESSAFGHAIGLAIFLALVISVAP